MRVAVKLDRYLEMIEVLQSMARHRQQRPTSRVDELYYTLLARYHAGILQAKDEGKPVVAHGVMTPIELFLALDLVPMSYHHVAAQTMFVLKLFDQVLGAGKGYGISPETCSGHICIPGTFVQGWAPRPDFIVWGHEPCDNSGKEGELVASLYGVPAYFLDRPYTHAPAEINYYARQLVELTATLEERFNRRLDPLRLQHQLQLSQRFAALGRELYEMKKASPSPANNRWGNMMMTIAIMYWGTPEGIQFFEAVRDEMKANLAQGKGYAPQEKFRLLCVYSSPAHSYRLLDWMHREHGASIVADTDTSKYHHWQVDFAQPMLSLARRFTIFPCGQMQGPVAEEWLPDVIEDAREFRVDGAIFWANRGCRHGPATARLFSDALLEKAGIPTLIADIDLHDPTYVTDEELRERLEGFFERLAERK